MSSSNRPGRSSAGSIRVGRLVAPITTTFWSSSSPSISARMVLTTRSVTCGSPMLPPRAGTRLSSSSMKITVGATWRAPANRRAICCSQSSYHLDTRDELLAAPQIGFASRAVGLAVEAGDVDIRAKRYAAGVDSENLAPPAFVGDADHDLAVEAAGAAQRLVDRLGPVGGGDDDEILARLQAVHQAQQLRDEAFLGLALDLAALGRDRV